MDTDVKWFSMPIGTQISNIGSEVNRAIRWKNRNEPQKARNFCNKAIEFLEIIKKDPKNVHRCRELDAAIEELRDYFMGDNIYRTSDKILQKYYDAFL